MARSAGEHTVIMLRPLQSPEVENTDWLDPFLQDFRCRFMSLLPGAHPPCWALAAHPAAGKSAGHSEHLPMLSMPSLLFLC
jgi:tRNA(Met) C34 N-acetyltransferase TmcA